MGPCKAAQTRAPTQEEEDGGAHARSRAVAIVQLVKGGREGGGCRPPQGEGGSSTSSTPHEKLGTAALTAPRCRHASRRCPCHPCMDAGVLGGWLTEALRASHEGQVGHAPPPFQAAHDVMPSNCPAPLSVNGSPRAGCLCSCRQARPKLWATAGRQQGCQGHHAPLRSP